MNESRARLSPGQKPHDAPWLKCFKAFYGALTVSLWRIRTANNCWRHCGTTDCRVSDGSPSWCRWASSYSSACSTPCSLSATSLYPTLVGAKCCASPSSSSSASLAPMSHFSVSYPDPPNFIVHSAFRNSSSINGPRSK